MNKKVVLITGASSGIGFDTAKALINKGMVVYATARRVERMKPLEDMGGKALYMDVTKQETIDVVVEQVIKEQGRIDVLFNNAGYATQGPAELVEIQEAQRQFDVNVFGTARVLKAVLPHMRKIKKGQVIVTSSAAGHVTMPGQSWYPATKHALDALIGGLRMELKDFKIDVSLLEPGYVNTEFLIPATETMDELLPKVSDPIYKKQMVTMRRKFKEAIDGGAKVESITKLAVKAINDKKPKRYYAASQARLAKLLKKLFGYSLLDGFMTNSSIK